MMVNMIDGKDEEATFRTKKCVSGGEPRDLT